MEVGLEFHVTGELYEYSWSRADRNQWTGSRTESPWWLVYLEEIIKIRWVTGC